MTDLHPDYILLFLFLSLIAIISPWVLLQVDDASPSLKRLMLFCPSLNRSPFCKLLNSFIFNYQTTAMGNHPSNGWLCRLPLDPTVRVNFSTPTCLNWTFSTISCFYLFVTEPQRNSEPVRDIKEHRINNINHHPIIFS